MSRTPKLLGEQSLTPYTDFIEYTPTFLGSYTVFAYALDNTPPCIQYFQFDVTAPSGTVIPSCPRLQLSFTPDAPTTGIPIEFTLQLPVATSTEIPNLIWSKTEGGILTETKSTRPTFSYIPATPGTHEVEVRAQFPSAPYMACVVRRQFTVGGVALTATTTARVSSATLTDATTTVLSSIQQEQLLFDQFQAFATAFNAIYASTTTTNTSVQTIQSAITQFIQVRTNAITGGGTFETFTTLMDMLYLHYSTIVSHMGMLLEADTSTSTLFAQFTQLNTNFQPYFSIFLEAYNPTTQITDATSTSTTTNADVPTTSTARGGARLKRHPGHPPSQKKSLRYEYTMARRQTRRANRKNRKATRKNRRANRK